MAFDRRFTGLWRTHSVHRQNPCPSTRKEKLGHSSYIDAKAKGHTRPLTPSLSPVGGEGVRRTGEGGMATRWHLGITALGVGRSVEDNLPSAYR